MAESQNYLKTSNVFSASIVCYICRIEIDQPPLRELLSNKSLFIGHLYEDKSIALRARDLIFFPTDLQTVNHSM